MEIAALTANSHAGKAMETVFPHLAGLGLPGLVTNEEADWNGIEAVFCGLPHATSQQVIAALPDHLKVIDMSADFRLRDPATYEKWYGGPHRALDLQAQAVYGLTEHYREAIGSARLVACPGMLSDRRAHAASAAGQGGPHRRRRSCHRRQVGRLGGRAVAEAEHPVLRGGRGAVALWHRQPPPRPGDRAGDLARRRPPR